MSGASRLDPATIYPSLEAMLDEARPQAVVAFTFLRYFVAVVRGEIQTSGLSSLKNNLVVTEILDTARRSAMTGNTVRLT